MKRSKLKPQRVDDLVFIHNNFRLLLRRSPNYNEGESKMLNVGRNGFDSMDIKNAGLLKIVDLYLDEPELEAVLFDLKGNTSI